MTSQMTKDNITTIQHEGQHQEPHLEQHQGQHQGQHQEQNQVQHQNNFITVGCDLIVISLVY